MATGDPDDGKGILSRLTVFQPILDKLAKLRHQGLVFCILASILIYLFSLHYVDSRILWKQIFGACLIGLDVVSLIFVGILYMYASLFLAVNRQQTEFAKSVRATRNEHETKR